MIRFAEKKDCINLTALSIQVWLNTYAKDGIRQKISSYVLSAFTKDHFERLLKSENTPILVYESEGHLVGYAMARLDSHFETPENGYEVDTLYVHDRFQGCGIGRTLLMELGSRFGEAFWLSTWHRNIPALNFYRSFGFKEVGTLDFMLGDEAHKNIVLSFSKP